MNKRANLEPFIENTIPVQQFADRIKSELAQSTTAWWTIAKIVGEADMQYGFSSRPMRELIRETNISTSKANKLLTISKSARIEENQERLKHTAAWTVLYELTTLTDHDFEKVLNGTDGALITVALINKVREKKPSQPKSQKALVSIMVDLDALMSEQFSAKDYGDLLNDLDEIQARYPNISIVDEGCFDRLQKEQEREIEQDRREGERKLKAKIRELIKIYKNHSLEWRQYQNVKLRKRLNFRLPYIGNWEDAEAVWQAALIDPEQVFTELGSEYRREDYF